MNILLTIILLVLIVVSSGSHLYFVLKKKDKKTFIVQIAILCLAALGGVLVIYNLTDPSLSKMLNNISPLQN
jgi:branched-subunit amino acid transport protein AzlD